MSDSPVFAACEAHKWKIVFFDSTASTPWSEIQADGLCAQREFFPLLLQSGLGGVKLRWAHKLGKAVLRLTGRQKEKAMTEAQLRTRSDGTKPNLIR